MSTFEPITMRDGKPAIDVKDRKLYAQDPNWRQFYDELGEDDMNIVFEDVQRRFWEEYAPELAGKYGYGKVYSEGRSGGWLIVENPPPLTSDDLDDYEQHESCEHNVKQWNAFERDIDELIVGCRAEVANILAGEIERRKSETAEAYEMACRDIETVA